MSSFGVRSVVPVAASLAMLLLPATAHASELQGPSIEGLWSSGETCGSESIDQASGKGPSPLALEVSESVPTQVTTTVPVDAEVVSEAVGFDVTESVTVFDESEVELERGETGELYAFPEFESITFDITGAEEGTGEVLRPVGVCFSTTPTAPSDDAESDVAS